MDFKNEMVHQKSDMYPNTELYQDCLSAFTAYKKN